MLEKKWLVLPAITETEFNKFPEINPIVLQLLYNRKIDNQQKIDEFLNPDYGENLYDPFLFTDMAKAVKRILAGIEKEEKIVVYGDYDADGVSSSAVVIETLNALGAQTEVYIPYRETEGYGLNKEAANELIEKGTKLVITVDCGISNKEEIKILQDSDVDVIVTDHHHEPPELPNAFAVINPQLSLENYPFKNLTGCGVAFKLAQGLIRKSAEYKVKQIDEGFEKWLLDLVAIGTIADLQPIISENRVLVKYGLIVLQKTRRLGLLKLIEKMNSNLIKIDERVVGWQISPRLNAAGRLGHASTAYELLISNDPVQAEKLANELNNTNKERQQITDKINQEVKGLIGEIKNQKILTVVGEGWPTGIVGLVAGRLTDEFNLPSLVISKFNGEIIGSGRSIPEFNIIEALEECGEFLSRYGGHAQACGFTVKDEKNLEKLTKKMAELANKQLSNQELLPTLPIDAEIKINEVNWELFEELEKFQPFGEGNPKPIFLAKSLEVSEMQKVGKEGKHLRLMVKQNTPIIRKTIGFCFGNWCNLIKAGDKIDLVFEVDVNEWNGNRELQLKIIDLKISDV